MFQSFKTTKLFQQKKLLRLISASICAGQSTTLTATGGTNYTWAPGSLTGSVVVVSPINNTNDDVTATNDDFCFPTANLPVMVNNCPLGIEQVVGNEVISVYPNPTTDVLTIDFNNAITETKFSLFNSTGALVETFVLTDQKNNISLQHLSTGLYSYQLKTKERIVKQAVLIKE